MLLIHKKNTVLLLEIQQIIPVKNKVNKNLVKILLLSKFKYLIKIIHTYFLKKECMHSACIVIFSKRSACIVHAYLFF